jgi:antitoxin (DNA-binding transcriptional repressor) of toxin-antitoxin stability system
MKTATVTESKNGLSELLRTVKAGKGVLILDRDVPVARLEPIAAGSLPDDIRLLALERQGLIRRPLETGSGPDRFKGLPPAPRLKSGRSAAAALLADREAGR